MTKPVDGTLENKNFLQFIPADLLKYITMFLDAPSLGRFKQICQYANKIGSEFEKYLLAHPEIFKQQDLRQRLDEIDILANKYTIRLTAFRENCKALRNAAADINSVRKFNSSLIVIQDTISNLSPDQLSLLEINQKEIRFTSQHWRKITQAMPWIFPMTFLIIGVILVITGFRDINLNDRTKETLIPLGAVLAILSSACLLTTGAVSCTGYITGQNTNIIGANLPKPYNQSFERLKTITDDIVKLPPDNLKALMNRRSAFFHAYQKVQYAEGSLKDLPKELNEEIKPIFLRAYKIIGRSTDKVPVEIQKMHDYYFGKKNNDTVVEINDEEVNENTPLMGKK